MRGVLIAVACFGCAALGGTPAWLADGGLELTTIRDELELNTRALWDCADGGVPTGTTTCEWGIDSEGTVRNLACQGARLPACVQRALIALRFPKADAGTTARTAWPAVDGSVLGPVSPGPEGVSDTDLAQIIDSKRPEVIECARTRPGDEESREGRIALELVTSRSGRVLSVQTDEVSPRLAGTTFPACLARTSALWVFPPAERMTRVVARWVVAPNERRAKLYFVPTEPDTRVVILPRNESPSDEWAHTAHEELARQRDTLRTCFVHWPTSRPAPDLGSVTIEWNIGVDGAVTDVNVDASDAFAKQAGACVEQRLRSWSFTSPGKKPRALRQTFFFKEPGR